VPQGKEVGQGQLSIDLAWSKVSNALKRFGFRSRNFLAQLLSETSSAGTIRRVLTVDEDDELLNVVGGGEKPERSLFGFPEIKS